MSLVTKLLLFQARNRFPMNATFPSLVCLMVMLKETNFRIQKMRAEIERSGETLLEAGELNQLGEAGLPEEQQFKTIAQVAISEGWSFTFLPDDRVRFAKL